MNWIKALDIKIFYFINQNLRNDLLDFAMPLVTDLGMWYFAVILAALFCVFYNYKGLYPFLLTSLSILSARELSRLFKLIFSRPRPIAVLENVHVLGMKYYTYSFPSGHTTVAFAFATILAVKLPKIRIPVIIIAALIGLSRIYVGAHYPSDVLAGAVLGSGVSAVILVVESKIRKKKK